MKSGFGFPNVPAVVIGRLQTISLLQIKVTWKIKRPVQLSEPARHSIAPGPVTKVFLPGSCEPGCVQAQLLLMNSEAVNLVQISDLYIRVMSQGEKIQL